MKKCTTCSIEKLESNFDKDKSKKDGLSSLCKECRKLWRKKNKGRLKELKKTWETKNRSKHLFSRKRRYRNQRENELLRTKEWKLKNNKKVLCHQAVDRAIKKGTLVRQDCIKCGTEKTHGHHPDYDKPLDVIWLCPKHHQEEHLKS